MDVAEADAETEPEGVQLVSVQSPSQSGGPVDGSSRRRRGSSSGAAGGCAGCRRRLSAVLCSHVGVAIMLTAYAVTGGFLFRTIELQAEIDARWKAAKLRDESVEGIWRLSLAAWRDSPAAGWDVGAAVVSPPPTPPPSSKENFTEALRELLRRHYLQMGTYEGGKANMGFEPDDELCWSVVGSILYCVMILTTVGYGHVTPRTVWGRLLTIVYGLLGVPLMILYLIKMGALFADGFRLFYRRVCCDLCCCKRCERARRRRRSTVLLYQTRSDAQTPAASGGCVYRVGYSKRSAARPGSDPTESPAEGGSDVTQSPLIHNENLGGYARGESEAAAAVTPAFCVNAAYHGSLPRSANRVQRDWKAHSAAHVYETISLIDDSNASNPKAKGRPRSLAQRSDGVPSPVHVQGRNVWDPDPLILTPSGFITGTGYERDGGGALERKAVSAGLRGGVGTLERKKTPEERRFQSTQVQRQASQIPKSDRQPSRVSGEEKPATKDRKQLQERPESKQNRSKPGRRNPADAAAAVVGSPDNNVSSSKAAASLPSTTHEGRQGRRTVGQQKPPSKTGANQQQSKAKGKRKRSGQEESGDGRRASQLGHSDESFVTAPDDSSSEQLASTDSGSGEDDGGSRRRRKAPLQAAAAAAAAAASTRKRKRKRETTAEKKDQPEALVQMTSVSVEEDSELRNRPASVAYAESDDGCLYGNRKRPVPIGACILVLLAYVFAGSLGFCLWEGWEYSVGPYFCFVSLSTIGFGDFVPGSGSRNSASTEKFLVLTVWLVLGLTLLAMCLILASEHFAKRSSQANGGGGGDSQNS